MNELAKKIPLLLLCFVIGIGLMSNATGQTGGAASVGTNRPNIVFMLVDNVGWGDIGIYGGGILRGAPTPRLDKLASEGLQLLNFQHRAFLCSQPLGIDEWTPCHPYPYN